MKILLLALLTLVQSNFAISAEEKCDIKLNENFEGKFSTGSKLKYDDILTFTKGYASNEKGNIDFVSENVNCRLHLKIKQRAEFAENNVLEFDSSAFIYNESEKLIWFKTDASNPNIGSFSCRILKGKADHAAVKNILEKYGITGYHCPSLVVIKQTAADLNAKKAADAQKAQLAKEEADREKALVTKAMLDDMSIWTNSDGSSKCFTAGTKISIPDSRLTKNIEDLQEGDTVFAFDHQTNQIVKRKVLHTMVRKNIPYLTLTFNDGTILNVTAEHPIFLPSENLYQNAGQLKAGDLVIKESGGKILKNNPEFVKSVLAGSADVYNLEVEDNNNYFANNILVHNYFIGDEEFKDTEPVVNTNLIKVINLPRFMHRKHKHSQDATVTK